MRRSGVRPNSARRAKRSSVGFEPFPKPGKNNLVDGYQFLTTGGTRVSYEVRI